MIDNKKINGIIDNYQNKVLGTLQKANEKNDVSSRLLFPFVTQNGKWIWSDKWSNGFFPGQMWLLFDITNDDNWKKSALKYTDLLKNYKDNGDFQDIGYIFYYSFVLGYKLTNSHCLKNIAIEASYNLFDSMTKSGFLKCSWLENGENINGIDGMMNIQLWIWAYEETKDPKFLNNILTCINTTRKTLFNHDGSSYEYAEVDKDGEFLRAMNKNSFDNHSVWTRGHVWGIYGLVEAYRLLNDDSILSVIKKLISFYLDNLQNEMVPAWDLKTKENKNLKDSSAAAAFTSALFKLSEYLESKSVKLSKEYYSIAYKTLEQLLSEYYFSKSETHEGILLHASTPLRIVNQSGESQIWGDFFLLEAVNIYKKTKRRLN